LDLLPLQVADPRGPQTVAISDQDHGRVAMAVAAKLAGAVHQPVDLALGEVAPLDCQVYDAWCAFLGCRFHADNLCLRVSYCICYTPFLYSRKGGSGCMERIAIAMQDGGAGAGGRHEAAAAGRRPTLFCLARGPLGRPVGGTFWFQIFIQAPSPEIWSETISGGEEVLAAKWGGLFLGYLLGKNFGGVTAIVSYRPGGRMQQSAVPSCAILSGEAREASGSETPRVHNVARWCGGVADRGGRSGWGSCRLSGFWARPQLRPWRPWTAAFTITGRSGSARRKRCVVGAGKRGGRAANL